MQSKKGAVEFSMTTVIVIILGITILSLGLIWIRNVIGKTTGLTKDAFQQADAAIADIFDRVDTELAVKPNTIEIPQDGADEVSVVITNFEDVDASFQATATSIDPQIECVFADTKQTTSKTYNLPSGKQAKIRLIVDEKGGSIGTKVCSIEVSGIKGDNQEELIILVQQKKAAFGIF